MIKLVPGILLNLAGVLIIWGRLHILYWGYGKTWVKLGRFLRNNRVGDGLTLLTLIGAVLIAMGWVLLISYLSQLKKRVG